MEPFNQIFNVLGFTDKETEQHIDTISKLIIVRFRESIKTKLTDQEKELLPDNYLELENILNIKLVPSEDAQIKLILLLTVVVMGILGELLASSEKKMSDTQEKQINAILNNFFKK